MAALGLGLKSETPALAGRSTEGQACASHITRHESVNLEQAHGVLSITHSVTAHKGNLSLGARTAKTAYVALISSHLDVEGKLALSLIDPCTPPLRASKSKTSQGQRKSDNPAHSKAREKKRGRVGTLLILQEFLKN